jgi:hypothetical protein
MSTEVHVLSWRVLLQASAAVAVLTLAGGVAAQEAPAYRDAKLSASQRAADLVSRMTLEEKAHQLRPYRAGHPAAVGARL